MLSLIILERSKNVAAKLLQNSGGAKIQKGIIII
jgi:hypothetical protein